MGKVTIIAELGSSPAPAWDFEPWLTAAADAGADAVKVQLFHAGHFPAAEQAAKRPLEFPRHRLAEFVTAAHAHGLSAGASVFDKGAVRLAAEHCDFIKLAAREQHNYDLILDVQRTGKLFYKSVSDTRVADWPQDVTLYAIQSYPAFMLHALYQAVRWPMFCKVCGIEKWGWSSHTRGYLDCVLAARLGASVIEKHLALSPTDLEAGHSLTPAQFAAMCRAIRKGER